MSDATDLAGFRVISLLTADNRYTDTAARRSVLVKRAALTEISQDDASFLAEDDHFKEHEARGFVKIITGNQDAYTVAQSMTPDRGLCQLALRDLLRTLARN